MPKHYTPEVVRPHPTGRGIHKLFRFANGYGASCVRFMLPEAVAGLMDRPYASFTNASNEWEVAVIRWISKPREPLNFELVYDTPVANDVIGYVPEDDLDALLDKIAELPPCTTHPHHPKEDHHGS